MITTCRITYLFVKLRCDHSGHTTFYLSFIVTDKRSLQCFDCLRKYVYCFPPNTIYKHHWFNNLTREIIFWRSNVRGLGLVEVDSLRRRRRQFEFANIEKKFCQLLRHRKWIVSNLNSLPNDQFRCHKLFKFQTVLIIVNILTLALEVFLAKLGKKMLSRFHLAAKSNFKLNSNKEEILKAGMSWQFFKFSS